MSTRLTLLGAQPSSTYRQSETGLIEEAGGNVFKIRVNGRDEAYEGLNGTWLDSDNTPGTEARIAFVQADPFLPVMFSRNTKPNAINVFGTDPSVNFFSNWTRFGSSILANGYLGELDVVGSEIITTEIELSESQAANIVRSHGGRRIIAAEGNLREVDEATGEVTEGPTALGADIESCHVDSDGIIVSVVSEVVVNVDCEDVFNEAYELAISEGEGAFDLGSDTCIAGSDYFGNLEGYYLTFLGVNPVPPAYSDCQDEWENGIYVGIKELFDEGYVDAGCTVPS